MMTLSKTDQRRCYLGSCCRRRCCCCWIRSVVLLFPFWFPVRCNALFVSAFRLVREIDLLHYSFRFGFLSWSCSSFRLLLTLVLVVLLLVLFQPPLFIVFNFHHKTNNRDYPSRPFYHIDPSLYRVVRYLFPSLYVSFLLFFFFLLLLPVLLLPLSYDREINT